MSFGASSYSAAIELPDITTLSGPTESLKEIGRSCLGTNKLYCRAKEQHSGGENSIAVFSLLPAVLWPAEIRDGLAKMSTSIAANGQAQVLRLKDLPGISADFSGMNKARFGLFSEQLGKLGMGIEPDTRFGGSLPDPADHVAFFVAEGLEKVSPFSTHYAVTSLLVRLAAAVAEASEGFSDAEASVILGYLSSEMELPTAEQRRLAARLSLSRVAAPNGSHVCLSILLATFTTSPRNRQTSSPLKRIPLPTFAERRKPTRNLDKNRTGGTIGLRRVYGRQHSSLHSRNLMTLSCLRMRDS